MDKLINLLNKLAFSFIKRKNLKSLLANMTTHISNCPLESSLKYKKLEKIIRINKILNEFSKIPLNMHKIVILYIEECWKKLVMENGYINIEQTLKFIECDIDTNNFTDPEPDIKYFFNINDFKTIFNYNIKPLNCQISKKENTHEYIKLCQVKPGLPELDGKLYGLCVEIDKKDCTVRIFGLVDNDLLRIYRNKLNLNHLYEFLKSKYDINKEDALPYINSISYRDFLVYDVRQISNRIKNTKEKYSFYEKSDPTIILSEYQFLTEYMKVDFITFLLEVGLKKTANFLYNKISFPIKYLDWKLQKDLELSFSPSPRNKNNDIPEQIPYEIRISGMNASDKIKSKAYDKLKMLAMSNDGAPKAQKYLDGILKIPFGIIKNEPDLDDPGKQLYDELVNKYPEVKNKYSKLGNNYIKIFTEASKEENTNIFCSDALKKMQKSRDKQQQYIKKVGEILEKCAHGHDLVKTQLKRLLAQWISGGQSGIVLGLEGPPGNGKTTLIKNGLAKCLVDGQGNPRPVGFVPLGGSAGASSIVGHGYTYQGSTWGRIVDILMDCNCMNPIFLFDELDKVSKTEYGREIISILTHLTDSTQNTEFFDKYFEGVPLDLSKSLMIFTFNDRSKIDPILLDRMTIIETKPLSLLDKKIISKKHLIPQITDLVDLEPNEINISNDELESLINDYTCEAGARQLKKLLESLIQELNLRRLCNPDTDMTVDKFLIHDVFKHKDKIRRESISHEPLIGQINGMWANSLGLGGILPIQVEKSYIDKNLVLTGTQGDIMKESMKCAETMAFNLVIKEKPNFNKDDMKHGLHVHCPSTSIPKDGPSAGGAICIAIFSYLCNKFINQEIAMTGEIDLIGRILPIGGLEAKLVGSKKAGIKVALIPKENEEQLCRLRIEDKSPEDHNFKIILVEHINEALPYFFDEQINNILNKT